MAYLLSQLKYLMAINSNPIHKYPSNMAQSGHLPHAPGMLKLVMHHALFYAFLCICGHAFSKIIHFVHYSLFERSLVCFCSSSNAQAQQLHKCTMKCACMHANILITQCIMYNEQYVCTHIDAYKTNTHLDLLVGIFDWKSQPMSTMYRHSNCINASCNVYACICKCVVY